MSDKKHALVKVSNGAWTYAIGVIAIGIALGLFGFIHKNDDAWPLMYMGVLVMVCGSYYVQALKKVSALEVEDHQEKN